MFSCKLNPVKYFVRGAFHTQFHWKPHCWGVNRFQRNWRLEHGQTKGWRLTFFVNWLWWSFHFDFPWYNDKPCNVCV